MSLKKVLWKILIFSVLQIGVYTGVRISPEEIEKIMNAMHRVKVVKIVKKERE